MIKSIVAALLVLLVASSAMAAQATLQWTYSAEDQAIIDGFRIYYGKTSHAGVTDPVNLSDAQPYETRVQLANPSARTHTLDLPPGTYFFRMTAYGVIDSVPADSPFSNEATGALGILAPGNVGVTITITFP